MTAEVRIKHFTAPDSVSLAWREMGEGRAVVLLHGLFSDAQTNWIKFGHAQKLAAAGCRVIMPDFRAHGLSDKPQDAGSYPRGILARDIAALIAHLALTDYDLGGFSLGARTVVQLVGEGEERRVSGGHPSTAAAPRRAILAGMGLEGLAGWDRRQAFFHEAIAQFDTARRGDPHWMAIQFMKTMKVDRLAAGHLLRTFEDAHPDWLAAFTMPTLVLCGTEDADNGSAPALADALPDATYAPVPGTHMSSVTRPEFGERLAAFVAAP